MISIQDHICDAITQHRSQWSDKVIEKIKKVQFFASQCIVAVV